jgi:hypothetical protein
VYGDTEGNRLVSSKFLYPDICNKSKASPYDPHSKKTSLLQRNNETCIEGTLNDDEMKSGC